MSNASPSAANRALLQARASADGKLHFSLQLGINHTCGQKNGQLGCCLCFPNGTGGDGSRAPALGHSRMERQDTDVVWAPRNQPHVDAHVSFQGSQLEMLDAITGSIAPKIYLTF